MLFVSRLVGEMMASGVIEGSSSPWASPVVLVHRKNGDLRFCVNCCKLNMMTRKDAFPLPRIDDLLDQLSGKTTLDATGRSPWHQIPKLRRHLQLKLLPFGLCNAPATFQRLMQGILSGLEGFCSLYIDDILVYSDSVEKHIRHLKIFARLKRAGLLLHPS